MSVKALLFICIGLFASLHVSAQDVITFRSVGYSDKPNPELYITTDRKFAFDDIDQMLGAHACIVDKKTFDYILQFITDNQKKTTLAEVRKSGAFTIYGIGVARLNHSIKHANQIYRDSLTTIKTYNYLAEHEITIYCNHFLTWLQKNNSLVPVNIECVTTTLNKLAH